MLLKFLDFAKFHTFKDRLVKNHTFEQNFQRDSDFLILANFTFCRIGVVKNLKFEQNFQGDSLFIYLFIFFILFCQISDFKSCFKGPGGQKSLIWAKFSTQLKFLNIVKFHVGLLQDRVVKNLKFEHKF